MGLVPSSEQRINAVKIIKNRVNADKNSTTATTPSVLLDGVLVVTSQHIVGEVKNGHEHVWIMPQCLQLDKNRLSSPIAI